MAEWGASTASSNKSLSRVTVRRFPPPYHAMLAICSDIDRMRIDALRETHRFLNTVERTSMGPGVGLDIADSIWLYKAPFHDPRRDDLAYFSGLSWDTPSVYGAELLHYARQGWIDTLHSYGNFSRTPGIEVRFTREHAARGLDVLQRNGVRLTVWVNHGDTNNHQNIGEHDFMRGDRPGSLEYHADLIKAYGTEFLWVHGGVQRMGAPTAIEDCVLNDGSHMFGFRRFHARLNLDEGPAVAAAYGLNLFAAAGGSSVLQLWVPQGLPLQLDKEVLDTLVEEQLLCVCGQHLGSMYPFIGFDRRVVEALRRLRKYQDEGLVLVARTSRLLHYNRVRDYLRFDVLEAEGGPVIDIQSIEDPVRGSWLPELEDLRGITFEVRPAWPPPELRLRGKPIAAREVRNRDQGDWWSIGVRWFEPDVTDHALPFLAKDRPQFLLWNEDKRAQERRQGDDVLAWLPDEKPSAGPASVRVIDRAVARYERGLDQYVEAFERIGFTEVNRGLDLGSGSGHWCAAFLVHAERVVGIDHDPACVTLASRIADRLGYASRAHYLLRKIEEFDFTEGNFDVVWSHRALQQVSDIESVIAAIAAKLRGVSAFYCAVSGLGFHLRKVEEDLAGGRWQEAGARIGGLLNGYLARCGVAHAPGRRIRLFDLAELLRVCRAGGLSYVGQPGILTDGEETLEAAPGADFVVRAGPEKKSVKAKLIERLAIETAWLEDLGRLVESGCPKLVCDVLSAVEFDQADAALRDLRARALISAGNVPAAPLFESLMGSGLGELTSGLYRHDRGEIDKAVAHYEAAEDSHPDKSFLIGACRLGLNDWLNAERAFSAGRDAAPDDPRQWLGIVAAALERRDDAAALRACREMRDACAARPALR